MKLFAHPLFFAYLIPVLAGIVFVFWLGKKLKAHAIRVLFSAPAYAKLTAPLRPESMWKNILFLLAVVFLFIALAGPQWGTELIEAQGTFSQTVIAVDVSASMRAQDVSPDRLDSAKTMLRMLIANLKDQRIGILAFTSQAFVQCPITTDQSALNYFVSLLRPDMLPVPGTSLAAPVLLSAKLLAKYPGQKALILLTDGEDHLPEDINAAKEAALKNNIRIIAIGIGTKQGSLIPTKTDSSGKALEYKKDKQGNTVVSKLDDKPLLVLAQATSGAYIPYTTPAQVSAKVEEALLGLDKTTAAAGKHITYKTRYQFPLVLSLICLAGYVLWPRGKRRRKKQP